MRLSAHFELAEFTRSQTAARQGIAMDPPEAVQANLARLCALVLEPLRLALGPVFVSSGFRPPELNRLVGGSPRSAHVDGRAADIAVPGMSPAAVAEWLVASGLPFDQIIHEFGQWVHVAVAPEGAEPRREALTARREAGRTVYLTGILPTEAAA